MLRRALTLLFVLGFVSTVAAQEPPHAAELRFVNSLRAKGYHDLALEYLERLGKQNPSPELLKVLPLELVKTRLLVADSEPEADKKIAQFDQARKDLEAYLKTNPTETDAKLQLARIGQFQGKAQLDRALAMSETEDGRTTEVEKARQILATAATQMEALMKDLKGEDAQNEAKLEHAVLLLEVARGYINDRSSKELELRGKMLKTAANDLEEVSAAFGPNNPNRYRAQLWAARAHDMNDDPDRSKKAFLAVLSRGDAKLVRQARYFQILGEHERVMNKSDRKAADCSAVLTAAKQWLAGYPKDKNTPEGLGCQWIVARENFELGKLNAATPATRDGFWLEARKIILELEQTPSEFASKSQQLKISILIEQKAFTKKIEDLKNFDDLYMRALYEHSRLINDDKMEFSATDKRKAQQQQVITILKMAVERSKVAKVPQHELDMARYLLTGYYFNVGAYREAAAMGEEYAKAAPKSPTASIAVIYAAQSLSNLIEDRAATATPAELQVDRDKLFALAKMMIDRWPGEPAGDYGRQLVVQELMRAGKEDEAFKLGGDHARFQIGLARAKENKHVEAIKMLMPIQPTFANYTLSQFRLAMAALQCELDKTAEKLPNEKRTWTEIAVDALRKVPTPGPNADYYTNIIYVESKKTLASQLYSQSQYAEMDKVLKDLGDKLGGLKFDADEKKSQELTGKYSDTLEALNIYSLYGRANELFVKGQHLEVTKLLDPVVDMVQKNDPKDQPQIQALKTATTLRTRLFNLCLRSNIQQSNIKRATTVLDVWTSLTEAAEREKDLMDILSQLVVVMNVQVKTLTEEKKTDELNKTKDAYGAFLAELEKKQEKPSLEFTMKLAQGYSTVGKYPLAVALLDKLEKPKGGMAPADDKEKQLRAARVLYIRQLRLSNDLQKADKELQTIMADWGRKDMAALMEEIYLLEAKKEHLAAYNRAGSLKNSLQKMAETNPKLHAPYFDVYYAMCYNKARYGLSDKCPPGDKEVVKQDAVRLLKERLDGKTNPELTGEAKVRFEKLLKDVEAGK